MVDDSVVGDTSLEAFLSRLTDSPSRPPSTLSVSGALIVPSSLRLLPYHVHYGTCYATHHPLLSKKSLSPLLCTIPNLSHPYTSMVSCDVRDSLTSRGRRTTLPARAYSRPLGGDVAAFDHGNVASFRYIASDGQYATTSP